MRVWPRAILAILQFGVAALLSVTVAHAQQDVPRVALKSGESTDLGLVYFVVNCRSMVVGDPEVEALDPPAEVTLTIRKEMVLPRAQNCANKVPGGTVVLTAKDVKERKEVRLTYRVKYKTKDGDRQRSNVFNVSLFP
ncbi:MAG TPA: hypothetical protein VKD43_00085 [Xanthobacteraceae bacterium]|nr:hypothetical protein [Xanthobacteraceae bacterium]